MVRRLLLFSMLCACDMLSTREAVATRDMSLYVTIASSDATGTHVTAELNGPFGGEVLGPNDSFTLDVSGAPLELTATGTDAWVADTAERGGNFAFKLHHEGDHDVTSIAPLASPSGIAATAGGGTLSITWLAQVIDGMTTELTITGVCIETQQITIRTDTGKYVVDAAALQKTPVGCPIRLALARALAVRTTPFGDEAFMQANLTQVETVQSTWVP